MVKKKKYPRRKFARITIEVFPDMHKKFAQIAAGKGQPMRFIVNNLIRKYIADFESLQPKVGVFID